MSDDTVKDMSKKWIQICNVSDLDDMAPGELTAFGITLDNGKNIAVALCRHWEEGKPWLCIENTCTHDGAPIEDGYVDQKECSVECARHGAKFSLETGKVISMPATEDLFVYPTRITDGILEIFA